MTDTIEPGGGDTAPEHEPAPDRLPTDGQSIVACRALAAPVTVNRAARTVEVVWSTGARARNFVPPHGPIIEELDMRPEAVRIRHELGGQPYGPEVIAEGLRMAGLVEPGIARTGTVRAAAGTAAAGLTAAVVIETVTALAPHADGLASVARALGPWGVALAVAGAAAWAIFQRLQRQREIVP